MKKIIFTLLVASVGFAASSCQKERRCACNAVGNLPATKYPLEKNTKSVHESECAEIEAIRKRTGETASCELE